MTEPERVKKNTEMEMERSIDRVAVMGPGLYP